MTRSFTYLLLILSFIPLYAENSAADSFSQRKDAYQVPWKENLAAVRSRYGAIDFDDSGDCTKHTPSPFEVTRRLAEMEKQQMGAGPLSGTSAFEEGSEASLAEAQRRLDHFINPTPAPTPAPSFGAVTLSYYSGLLLPQKNMTYYCRPFHYQGAKTSTDWQRIDGGITANSSYFANIIKKAEVEILDYDARYDELGMISNDYERQIFGFKGTDESGNVNPGKLEIRKLDSSQTPTDHEWTIMLRQVAYRMKTLAVESRVNLCKDFVGKYTRTFKYVITDTNDVESPPYYKTMNVQSAVIMYTDVSVEVTNAEDLLYLGRPRNFQNDLASEFSVDAQMERSGEEPVKESKFRRLSTSV